MPLMTLPGMRERYRAHRLGRQDLLAHRLEGRLRHRRAARCCGRSPRRTSSSPSPRRRTCSTRSPTASPRTTPTSPGLRAGYAAQARPLGGGAARARLRRAAAAGHLLHHRRHSGRWASTADDADFCRHLIEAAGVTAIPLSAFYEGPAPDGFVRFCFCKRTRCWTRRWGGSGRGWQHGCRRRRIDAARPGTLNPPAPVAGVAQVVRAPGCGPGCRGFESHRSPQPE